MFKKCISVITVVSCIALIAGCATIMHGTTQSVGISSSPSGALVTVDNMEKGRTPVVVDLRRKEHHFVKIEMEGYKPYEVTLTRGVSGWVWGNIVFGGLVGLAVDAITGGLYKLTPAEVNTVLRSNKQGALYRDNMLYVAVVLEPNPGWQKIGQLNPAF